MSNASRCTVCNNPLEIGQEISRDSVLGDCHSLCLRELRGSPNQNPTICKCCMEAMPDHAALVGAIRVHHECRIEFEERLMKEHAEKQARARDTSASAEAEKNKLISIVEKQALSSLPPWEHAVVGSEVFEKMPTRLKQFALKWASGSTLMVGPSGIGKSTSAAAMARRYVTELAEAARVSKTIRVRIRSSDPLYPHDIESMGPSDGRILSTRITWTTGFRVSTARKNSPLGAEPKLISDVKSTGILLLDEIGFESRDSDVSSDLFDVIYARYESRLPTIVTSGMRVESLISRYGDGLVRRLTEEKIGRLIDCYLEQNVG